VISGASGLVVGALSAVDADSSDSHSFSLSATDAGLFEIMNGNTLKLSSDSVTDYAVQADYQFELTATDSSGLSYTQSITIEVDNPVDRVIADTPFSFSYDVVNASEASVELYNGVDYTNGRCGTGYEH
jgi:hypothetical protein